MDAEQYRDRFEHEFDERPEAYEDVLQDELTQATGAIPYNEFETQVHGLNRSGPDADIVDGEALSAYDKITDGRIEELNYGEIHSLYLTIEEIEDTATDAGTIEQYGEVQQKVEELEYLHDLEDDLARIEQEYSIEDSDPLEP